MNLIIIYFMKNIKFIYRPPSDACDRSLARFVEIRSRAGHLDLMLELGQCKGWLVPESK